MLSAYLYRVRKSLIRAPGLMVLYAFFLGYILFMSLVVTSLNEGAVRNQDAVVGLIKLVWFGLGILVLGNTCTKGSYAFSLTDVNFHFAGPFTTKFNLIIAVINSLPMTLIYMYFSSMLMPFASNFGFTSKDAILMVCGGFVVVLVCSIIGFLVKVTLDKLEKFKKVPMAIIFGAMALALAGCALMLLSENHWSIKSAFGQDIDILISRIGNNPIIDFFPIVGWPGLIVKGIYLSDVIFIAIGAVLSIGTIGAVAYIFTKANYDYYETAIEGATRIAEITEAKKANVFGNSDINTGKIVVGKEKLGGGRGASAIFYRHLLENKRRSHFSFININALIYKAIVVAYLFFMSKSHIIDDGSLANLAYALGFGLTMNIFVFSGSKTLTELSKPYIFLIPDTAQKKLFASVFADFPEMAFDALVMMIICMVFAPGARTVPFGIAIFLIVASFNFLCQTISILCVRILSRAGAFIINLLRTILDMAVVGFGALVGFVVMSIVDGGIEIVFFSASGVLILASFLALLASRNIIDKTEMR